MFATENDYLLLKYFDESEFSRPCAMEVEFLNQLDAFRNYLNLPLYLSSTNPPSRPKTSQHSKGVAADIVCPDFKGTLFEFYLLAEKHNFNGLGVYPDWTYKGKKIGGLHVDNRILKGVKAARWIGIKDYSTGKNEYLTLNYGNLKMHKII